jgi:KDO2-lipid IV(A) lauroyltransferase
MEKTKKNLVSFNSLYWPLYWPAWCGLGLLWLITRLPYHWQITIGSLLGKILYLFPTKLKHIMVINLKLCFPEFTDAQRDLLARKNFSSLGIGLIEAAMAWWLPDDKIHSLYKIHGLEHAEKAFAKGRGIILIGPHFTCLELVGRLIRKHYLFAVMYRPHKKALISFIHERFRKKYYVHYIPRNRIRGLLQALKDNMAIWYAYDIDPGEKHSVFAPFFGISTASLTSASRIAHLSKAAVIPVSFCRREDNTGYDVMLLPPLENFPSDNPVVDATRLNAILEEAIRHKPEQYVWQYKRFKTRPAGEKRFY